MVSKSGNIFKNLPDPIDEEIFELLCECGKVKIERIISKEQRTPSNKWYDQPWDEWILIEQGRGVLEYEDGSTQTLKKGDFTLIPKGVKHRVFSTEQSTIWLAIHMPR